MPSTILITGSDGFIGKSLSQKLKDLGHNVIGVDKNTGVDLTCRDSVKSLPDVDIVIHLAAFNGTKFFYTNPFDVITNNILPTQYLLERYVNKVKKFVFTGTSESYAGTTDIFNHEIPTDESVPLTISDVTNPRWSYAGSKICNELQVIACHKQFNQNFNIIRYHNVYGPDQTYHFIPEFIERAKKGDYTLHGWNNTRSFIYIDDAVDATIDIIFNSICDNEIIHVGNEDEVSMLFVAEKILNKLNIDAELILAPAPDGSTQRRCPNNNKLKKLIDYQQTITLDEGLDKIIKQSL
jgi:nucleoside-diphosphate-sugar epimerase